MNSQQYAIDTATEFLKTYILTNRELNGEFKTAINKREAKDVSEDGGVDKKDRERASEGSSLFWTEVRWAISQATMENFAIFFAEQEEKNDLLTAQQALKSVASIAFDLSGLSGTTSLSDYISSTQPFAEYKQKSLRETQEQLVKVEAEHKKLRESGKSVTTVDQNNHDKIVGVLKEAIARGGRPILTPPEFLRCYTAVLDDVVARSVEVIQWSAPLKSKPNLESNPKPKRKRVANANG